MGRHDGDQGGQLPQPMISTVQLARQINLYRLGKGWSVVDLCTHYGAWAGLSGRHAMRLWSEIKSGEARLYTTADRWAVFIGQDLASVDLEAYLSAA